VTFRTSCSSITVTQATPFFENFDASPWMPNIAGYGTNIWDPCWSLSPVYSSNFAWQVQTGGTPSSNTGPLGAYSGANYIYPEASIGSQGSVAIVKSPSLTLSTTNPQLSFAYHMYGANQDALYIDISTNSGATFTTIDSVTSVMSNQSDPWSIHYTDLSSYENSTVVIALRVIKGSSWTKDVGIDDFSVAKKQLHVSQHLTSLVQMKQPIHLKQVGPQEILLRLDIRFVTP